MFYYASVLGVTAGAHRYFCHKSFKATLPLQIALMLFHSLAYQRTLVTWIRDHRLHHKYTDTDADPHNISRGFFYSHLGWLLVDNHPELKRRKGLVDMKDVYGSSVVMFQKRHSRWLLPLTAFIVPTLTLWVIGETLSTSWYLNILRYIILSHITFLNNSLAHYYGYKPYDKAMSASQNLPLVLLSLGEGFHNFHHAFPWDYRTGEIAGDPINTITKFIDICGKCGLAFDMKEASEELVKARMKRTGDGSDLWGSVLVKNLSG
ncbi:acyl-CoA Delta(11) desaturase-like [Anticarsia gemmatalis]|uniref:acyl-CoA Delta(11) desaturase-like n=1 Tax=Anticarsia gemmatalis TaxID=129554 RepID=UPI003F75841D